MAPRRFLMRSVRNDSIVHDCLAPGGQSHASRNVIDLIDALYDQAKARRSPTRGSNNPPGRARSR